MNEKKDISSVLCELDGNMAEMIDIANLFQLFDETLWDGVETLDPHKQWTTEHFKRRFEVVYSTLTVARIRLHEVLNEMKAGVATGYEILNEARTKPEKTEVLA